MKKIHYVFILFLVVGTGTSVWANNLLRVFEFKGMQLNEVALGEILSVRGDTQGLKHLLGEGLVATKDADGQSLLKNDEKGIFIRIGKVRFVDSEIDNVVFLRLFGEKFSIKVLNKVLKKGDSLTQLKGKFQVITENGQKKIVFLNIEGNGEEIQFIFDENDKFKEFIYSKESISSVTK